MSPLNFSQTHGLEKPPGPLGLGEFPRSARNAVWTIIYNSLETSKFYMTQVGTIASGNWGIILKFLHLSFFHLPADEHREYFEANKEKLKTYIYSQPYNKVFDLLCAIFSHPKCPKSIVENIAKIFESEHLAYKLLIPERMIVQRISQEEENAFIAALDSTSKGRFDGSQTHLKRAAEHLRSGSSADSIRESIHAVESVLKILAKDEAGDFSKALAKISPVISLHPALKKGFDAIYGYTSDEKGIRHALLEETSNATKDEAIFMLSSCSSMISYLINRHDTVTDNGSKVPK